MLLRIGDYGADARVSKDDLPEELADCSRPQTQTRHGTFAAVFSMDTREIEGLMPPGSHVWGGEPFQKQGEIRSAKRPE